MFEEPTVSWPPSLTDPSQNITVDRLVAAHVRAGKPKHGLPFGDDLSRVGFTELHAAHRDLSEQIALQREKDKAAAEEPPKKEVPLKEGEVVPPVFPDRKVDPGPGGYADRLSALIRDVEALKASSPPKAGG